MNKQEKKKLTISIDKNIIDNGYIDYNSKYPNDICLSCAAECGSKLSYSIAWSSIAICGICHDLTTTYKPKDFVGLYGVPIKIIKNIYVRILLTEKTHKLTVDYNGKFREI